MSGEITYGGRFTEYNHVSSNKISKLDSTGSLDPLFVLGTGFGTESLSFVNTLANQSDGKVLVGGSFTSYNGTNANNIIRLNSDGTVDNTFDYGVGFTGIVNKILIQSDGKILVGGEFNSYSGSTCNRLIRLNSNGTIDNTLSLGNGFTKPYTPLVSSSINDIIELSNGDLLCAGNFERYDTTDARNLVKISNSGSLNTSFNSNIGGLYAFNQEVSAITTQSDNKIIAVGFFDGANSITQKGIIRFNSDGTKDTGFSIGGGFTLYGSNPNVFDVCIQFDGSSSRKIVVVGEFDDYDGNSISGIIRLNNNGSKDSTFNMGTGFGSSEQGYVVEVDTDNNLFIGGNFSYYNGTLVYHAVKLISDGTLDSSFKQT